MTARAAPLILSLLLSLPGAAVAEELADSGRPAPMFRLPVYNPKPVGATALGLDQYVGAQPADPEAKVVLLSFMASFCAPCKKEMPWLQKLQQKHGKAGLRVVMISIDTEEEGQKIIEGLIAKNKITYPVLKDRFNLVARRYLGTQSPLPSVFLIKGDGTIAAAHKGYSEVLAKKLEAEVKAQLAEAVR